MIFPASPVVTTCNIFIVPSFGFTPNFTKCAEKELLVNFNCAAVFPLEVMVKSILSWLANFNTSIIAIFAFASVFEITISFLTSNASAFMPAKTGADLMAISFNFCCNVLQAKSTADPTVEVVPDPPCEGPGGKSESPSLNLIF